MIKKKTVKKYVNLAEVRAGSHERHMHQVAKKGICPFCAENIAAIHARPILIKGRYWTVTDNMFPYDGARHHILLIHNAHIKGVDEVMPAAWKEFGKLVGDMKDKRSIHGGSIVMRFGDNEYTGGTIHHLHAHIISGARRIGGGKLRESVFARVAYKRK